MNIIKDIKSFFSRNTDGSSEIDVKIILNTLDYKLQYGVYENIASEVSKIVAETFLKENHEIIRKQILENPNFADSVYNAIVLKKAEKI